MVTSQKFHEIIMVFKEVRVVLVLLPLSNQVSCALLLQTINNYFRPNEVITRQLFHEVVVMVSQKFVGTKGDMSTGQYTSRVTIANKLLNGE